jgi:hypothetical protein
MGSFELLGRHRSWSDLRGNGRRALARRATPKGHSSRCRMLASTPKSRDRRADASPRHRSRESRRLDEPLWAPKGASKAQSNAAISPSNSLLVEKLRRCSEELDALTTSRVLLRGALTRVRAVSWLKRADRRGAARTGHPLFEPHLERRAHSPAPKSSLAAWALCVGSRASSSTPPSSQVPKNKGVRRIRWRARQEFSAVENYGGRRSSQPIPLLEPKNPHGLTR